MKLHMEVECSPEEARAFLGLPDLRPMQQAVMARMEQQMVDAIAAASPEALLRGWMPLLPANLAPSADQLRDATLGMMRMFLPGGAANGATPGEPGKG